MLYTYMASFEIDGIPHQKLFLASSSVAAIELVQANVIQMAIDAKKKQSQFGKVLCHAKLNVQKIQQSRI